MSGDDHGHGHGHDAHDGPSDIIPLGSWQDNFLALVALATLGGFFWWGQGFASGIKVPTHSEHHASTHEPAAAGHESSTTVPHAEHFLDEHGTTLGQPSATTTEPGTPTGEHATEGGAAATTPATSTDPSASSEASTSTSTSTTESAGEHPAETTEGK